MIDRRLFTPDRSDPDFPVGITPTCSVPSTRMAVLLADLLGTTGKVLEIGTGSGFNTAVLAERCREVVSVEAQPLHEVQAKLPENVTLITADGCAHDTGEEFDGILVTFAAPRIMHVWFKQLREGGKLVVPLKIGSCCRICVYVKKNKQLELVEVNSYAHFTPYVEA